MDHYRSEHLIFRGANPEDDPFFEALTLNSQGIINSSPFLLVPPNKKHAEEFRSFIADPTKVHIGVIICLPGPSTASGDEVSKPIPIGYISIMKGHPGTDHHRNGNIGLGILPAHQRQGYGRETIEWVLNWAFQIAGLHRVGIGHFSYNSDAGRLYKNMGFVYEGTKREALWWDGGWHDIIELSMLEAEWRERKRSKESGETNAKNQGK